MKGAGEQRKAFGEGRATHQVLDHLTDCDASLTGEARNQMLHSRGGGRCLEGAAQPLEQTVNLLGPQPLRIQKQKHAAHMLQAYGQGSSQKPEVRQFVSGLAFTKSRGGRLAT